MHKIDHTTAVGVLPTPAPVGTPGHFTDGNPITAVPATVVTADWANAVQGEMTYVIEQAGLTLSKTDNTQLRAAILKMISDAAKVVRIDSATFAVGVANGDVVRWDSGASNFAKAIADGTTNNMAVGVADVTNSRVYVYGETPALFSGLTPGSRYYLDGTTAGAVTSTKPADGVIIGIAKSATTMFVDIDPDPAASMPALGQCEVVVVSSTQIKLQRKNGKKLTINGVAYDIPSAGVTLANTGLTAATLYYIYAYMAAGVMTLEASTTGHSTDTTTGMEIKTGDATRTLVSAEYMDAGTPGTFADSATKRYHRSWFNDPGFAGRNNFTADRTTTSLTDVEINTEIRIGFVLWAGEIVTAAYNGTKATSTTASGASPVTSIGWDSATMDAAFINASESASTTRGTSNNAAGVNSGLSEGYHYATLVGKTSAAATATWHGTSGVDITPTYLMIAVPRHS